MLKKVIVISLFSWNVLSVKIYAFMENLFPFVEIETLLFIASFIWISACASLERKLTFSVLVYFSMILFISSLNAENYEYGIMKNMVGLVLPLALYPFIKGLSLNRQVVTDSFIYFVLLIDLIALVYKLNNGFMVRQVNYGFLGPITFAWLNTFALGAILKTRGVTMLLWIMLLMIVWSGSKGPFLVSLLFLILNIEVLKDKLTLSNAIIGLTFLVIIAYFLVPHLADFRIFKTIIDISTGGKGYLSGAGAGSIGSRANYFGAALGVAQENLQGIGFGDWLTLGLGHNYPHNLFLEILVEVGVLGVLLYVFVLRLSKNNVFGYLFLIGTLLQMTSGDFSYFRYSLIFLLFGFADNVKSKIRHDKLEI